MQDAPVGIVMVLSISLYRGSGTFIMLLCEWVFKAYAKFLFSLNNDIFTGIE